MPKINIAVDGHSSCGKSTTSRLLARRLSYKYIDTGAMYRAVTLYLLRHGIDWNDPVALAEALDDIRIDFSYSEAGGNRTWLNGEDVEEAIRSMEVSSKVSEVSTVSAIRRKLVEQQQAIAEGKGVVMDGRDIGSVVLPDAELKVFMTASIEARTGRRWKELRDKGREITREEVQRNLEHRDHIDSTREDSPLMQAGDALLLDTSGMTIEEQTEWIIRKVEALLKAGDDSVPSRTNI